MPNDPSRGLPFTSNESPVTIRVIYSASASFEPFAMEKFDLIVIGSGPAGQRAAIQSAKFGKRVALVEKLEVVGGVAINTGTIPSKTIREAVLHLSGFYYQNIYGVNYRVKEQITMGDLSFRAQHVIKTEVDVTEAQLLMIVDVVIGESVLRIGFIDHRRAGLQRLLDVEHRRQRLIIDADFC